MDRSLEVLHLLIFSLRFHSDILVEKLFEWYNYFKYLDTGECWATILTTFLISLVFFV